MRRILSPTRPLALLVLAAALLAGCTAADDEPSTETTATEAGSEAAEDLQAAGGQDAEPIPMAELPVLASRTTADSSVPLEIELNSVTVSGDVLTVVFTARNTGSDKWQIAQFFDDGHFGPPLDEEGSRGEGDTSAGDTTDGVSVLDPVNALVHRAAYDTAGSCVCSGGLSSTFVGPGEQVVLTTAFRAPPEDVTTVTVQIPGAGSFDDVALDR